MRHSGQSAVRVYAEHAHRVTATFDADGRTRRSVVRRFGACVDVHEPSGGVTHRFADGDDLLACPPVPLAAAVVAECRRVQALPLADLTIDAAAELRALAVTTGATITWGAAHRQVAAGDAGAVTHDDRLVRTVEVSISGGTHVLRGAVSIEDLAVAVEHVRDRQAVPLLDRVPGGCDIVLPPGRAGAFFHELVGHPMEADVVASGTSYLGRRIGHRVAPDWFSVLDGGGVADHGYRAAVDDEGTRCRTATLVHSGVVGEPLTDLVSAAARGTAPTGHGRRLDYRHMALPRMSHTCATVGDHAGATDSGGPAIEPLGLQLRLMSLSTGDFVFRARGPILRGDDGAVHRLPPLLLSGNGLTVLAALAPGPPGTAEYCRATGGCGKLGQFPLLVSFANAGLRLPAGTVGVKAADG